MGNALVEGFFYGVILFMGLVDLNRVLISTKSTDWYACYKIQLKTLAEIFRKANPPAVPPRMPVREVGQKKLQEVSQEGTHMKSAPQSNSSINAEPLRVPILEAYPDELQPVK